MSQWINFTELRKQLNFADVLASYNVQLEPKGNSDQHVGTCPLPSHREAKGKTFSANFAKGVWQCFGCHESGNIIDFAVLMEGKNKKDGQSVRAVATALKERFVEKRPAGAPAESTPKHAPVKSSVPTVVNQPLDFALKTLEASHPYFEKRNILPETIARFGLGFCKRGSLSGRIAIPLEDDAAQLIGYAGLDPNGASGVPRYVFPAPREHEGKNYVFDTGKFLYNGHRLAKAVKDLIVVRECHTVWHLFQGGFANVVALMADRGSEDQAAMIPLLTGDSARIWLLTDSSVDSERAAAGFLPLAAANRLCRWIKVKSEDEMVPDHPLLRALLKR